MKATSIRVFARLRALADKRFQDSRVIFILKEMPKNTCRQSRLSTLSTIFIYMYDYQYFFK